MSNCTTLINYQNHLEFESIEMLIEQTKEIMNDLGIATLIKKRVINVMVEGLENIHKYSEIVKEFDSTHPKYLPKFILESDEDNFYLTFGNTIINEIIKNIQSKNDHVNSLDRDGLNKFFENIIERTTIHEKGGAGLGTVMFAQISGHKLEYYFEPLTEKYSYYTIRIKITKRKC